MGEVLSIAGIVITAIATGAAVCAAWDARKSRKIAQQAVDDAKADELLMVGEFHHPTLLQSVHQWGVIGGTVFNKSKRKAAITEVRLLDSSGGVLPATWSSRIDPYGNTGEPEHPLGVLNSVQLYGRRSDGEAIQSAQLEIHHTFPNSPIVVPFEMESGWDRWALGGPGPAK